MPTEQTTLALTMVHGRAGPESAVPTVMLRVRHSARHRVRPERRC